ncbi:hypothetical protein DYB32_006595 [Aphanomyces invadans]|uniref:TAZ-type domain-containing protein n=1 Tax=Aphanomyces invadans TaxID=157072 RepID=A0A3R6WJA8_9STRA|nr:hypothetical protein DYB32_006595 [Aphanomyces invadans]
MLPPPGAVLSPQPILVQPPVGVIAPPHQAMAAPIAYTPSPTAPPPVMTQEEKIKKLFRLILERFPDKYKPLFEEVRTRQIGVKNDMNFIVDLVKRSLGEPIFNVLCQEVGGFSIPMILHCQKCSLSSGCPAPGCSESKEYMREMQNPATTVVKAKTYLQVFNHYKQCPNKVTCPVCSVSLQPLPFATAPPQQPATNTGAAVAVPGLTTKRPGTATSPRSPLDGGPAKKVKASPANSFAPSSVTKKALASNATAYLQQNHPGAIETYDLTEELAPTNANDLRREADVLTHTNIDPQVEKRIMLAGVPPKAKQLGPKRETWSELFQHQGLQQTMAKAFIAGGLQPQTGEDVTEVMGLALHEYLKQALEEMVEIAKQRNDAYANSIPRKQPPPPSSHPAKTAVEILRLSSDEHFNRQMQADQALRSELLEEGRKDESADKDKNNKRRKGKANPKAPPSASSTSKKDLMDKDEEDMDIDELARKDLKLKLTQEGSVMLEGRVNTSIAPNARRNKHEIQVTMEDAEYWLRSQKPYVDAKLFCRAMAARIHSKNL